MQYLWNMNFSSDWRILPFLLGFLLSSLPSIIYGQQSFNDDPYARFKVTVKKINQAPNVDGILDELIWQNPNMANNFWQRFPVDSLRATKDTEISFAYDEKNLYVAIKCYTQGKELITPSLKRDYDFTGSDNITLLFDSYADKNNAFVFGINPFGVRREALVANGGGQGRDFDTSWDNWWSGDAQIFEEYWTAELAIPFKTLRYKEGSQKWRFNAYRNDSQFNEITTWMNIPRNRMPMDLTYMGEMIWEEPLGKPGKNIAVIPYAAGGINRDYEDLDQSKPLSNFTVGGDAKIGISAGLNLDLTANPDFSQVEVDRQVTNLDRFELLFPERRQFFLENADLFGSFGARRANPFFSRRIGVAIDTATGQNVQNPILYGARLSGKVNENLRVGLLNMQTMSEVDNDLPSFNFTTATAQHKVFDRSVVSFMLVNKQAINADQFSGSFENFNRVAGLEYRYQSVNNHWISKTSIQKVFSPSQESASESLFSSLIFNNRKYRFELVNLYIGNGFNPEVGYAPRRDIYMVSPEAAINFYPKRNDLSRVSVGFDSEVFFKPGKDGTDFLEAYGVEEWNWSSFARIEFSNSVNLRGEIKHSQLTLLDDFDPTRIQEDSIELPAGSRYAFTEFSLNFRSDRRKKFNFRIAPVAGTFYNGTRAGVRGQFTYRYQPFGSVSLAYTYNYIKMEAPFVPSNLWLIGPRLDLTFTKQLFLTTFIQYNNQLDNLNINTRFQWRFRPVSDFFLVYTDNYITESFSQFGSRNRALVAKLTFWLNL